KALPSFIHVVMHRTSGYLKSINFSAMLHCGAKIIHIMMSRHTMAYKDKPANRFQNFVRICAYSAAANRLTATDP
ncbi:MAG TPA: hypothetical protein PKI03_33500, partial [Pseudomonadota bacterium]|nr:hypothetical protein [Pseudomonadota bacterium]